LAHFDYACFCDNIALQYYFFGVSTFTG